MRDLDKAQPEFEKELQTNPNHGQANYMLGDIFVSLRDPAKAIPYLEKSVTLNPTLWDAHRSLGRALVMQEKYAEGIEQFQVVASAFPQDDSIHGLLSNAYRRLGNMQKAEEEGKLFQKLSAERLARVHKPTPEEPPPAETQP
jgi:tetratricopeptide (TPR) repeat protein